MLKLLSLTAAFGAICLFAPLGASASPLGLAKGTSIESQLLEVRDGCGRGMRFSNRQQACVEDFDRGPPQERYIEERRVYRDRVDPGAAAAGAAAGAIVDGVLGGPRYYDDRPYRRY